MAYEAYGPGVFGPYRTAGAPAVGTNEVQTLTIGGAAPAGDTITLNLDGLATAAIPWSGVNATLLASMNAALNNAFGTSEVVATAGTLTAGIGTVLLTFSGPTFGRRAVNTMTASRVTTSTLTVSVAETTPGVNASVRGAPTGAVAVDTTGGKLYIMTGGAWVVVGSQT